MSIKSSLTALSELGFPSAVFDDFFAAVASRLCYRGMCETRPDEIEFYAFKFTIM